MLMTKLLSALRAVPALLVDLLGVAGVALVSYGSWLVYEPAGFIVAGALFIAGALALSRTPGSVD